MLLLTDAAPCFTAGAPRRVLILDSFGRDVSPFVAAVSVLRATLAEEFGEAVDFHDVSLDMARFGEAEQETAGRLQPEMVVADISLTRDSSLHWLQRLRQRCPEVKLIVLSFHDEPSVRRAAMESGADGFVLKRAIATDLLPTVESVLAGSRGAPPANGGDDRGQK